MASLPASVGQSYLINIVHYLNALICSFSLLKQSLRVYSCKPDLVQNTVCSTPLRIVVINTKFKLWRKYYCSLEKESSNDWKYLRFDYSSNAVVLTKMCDNEFSFTCSKFGLPRYVFIEFSSRFLVPEWKWKTFLLFSSSAQLHEQHLGRILDLLPTQYNMWIRQCCCADQFRYCTFSKAEFTPQIMFLSL